MSNVIPFGANTLPSYLQNREGLRDVNVDIVTTAQFPNLSIKGKVFTLVRDGERTIITRPEEPDEAVQNINLAFIRLNMKYKNYYSKRYDPDSSEGQRPDCFSQDGVAPSPQSPAPQAKKCALCPHNQFGTSRNEDGTAGKGKACADQIRAAVANPDNLEHPLLLRIPPKSIKNLKDALRVCKTRHIPYNAVVFRVGFVAAEASPVLSFKPSGLLSDEAYAKADSLFEDETVQAIVGLIEEPVTAAQAEPEQDDDGGSELDAALAARAEAPKATSKPKPKPEPEIDVGDLDAALQGSAPARTAPKPSQKPKPKPEVDAAALDSVLGATPETPETSGQDEGLALLDDLSGLLEATDD